MTDRELIGWRECVALPTLGLGPVKVKVDTGARSSSLHAYNIEFVEVRRHEWVTFDVHPRQKDNTEVVACRSPLHDLRSVRSSNGRSEERPVIRTEITLGELTWEIDLTLTSRDEMGFRMLLGREALRGRFIVDVGRSFVFGRVGGKSTSKSTTKRPSKRRKEHRR